MAFNFNWSPLTADAGFYTRAQELLTTALNKSPKPPIIVDDILVNELNLGHVPPELEILEIGDLAEDRFRGIFKMSYNGDAFLTLKTRVQANPLNTYLLTRPAFASPQPLAAATGLTIPLQITLSDIKLSGFIILVFSRQKGLTLVFRNDPLESLKVSSTFDSIPFVANYLQKEIEAQLRTLLMDELPAIIHRLSLRLWVPEHKAREEQEIDVGDVTKDEPIIDPLASPPQDPVDSTGHPLNPTQIASLSLDSGVETHSLFSQKNLIRLATLNDSHRTLSLFTPSIRDAVFRAWAGPIERGEHTGFHSRAPTPALSRTHSYAGSMSTAYTFDNSSSIRPSMQSFGGSYSSTMNSARQPRGHGTRKRKKRVVNLRRQPETGEVEAFTEDGSTVTDTASVTESTSSAPSVFSAPPLTISSEAYRDVDPMTPPTSPSAIRSGKAVDRTPMAASSLEPSTSSHIRRIQPRRSATHETPPTIEQAGSLRHREGEETIRSRRRSIRASVVEDYDATPRASMFLPERKVVPPHERSNPAYQQQYSQPLTHAHPRSQGRDLEKPTLTRTSTSSSSSSKSPMPNFLQFITDPANGGSITERAWMVKMASEVSRRYEEEREKGRFERRQHRGEREDPPPPAYAR